MPANYTSIYDFGLNICMKTLREMMDLIESAQQGVAGGNDKNVVVKFSASEYAAMSPEQKNAKQQEWQTLKQQAKRQLKNFTLVDTDKEQGVAEANFPGAPDVTMPPMKFSSPEKAKLTKEYNKLHSEIRGLVDRAYGGDKQAKARIAQIDARIKVLKSELAKLGVATEGVAEGSVTPNVTVNKVHDDGHEKEWHVFRGKEMIGYIIKNQPDTSEGLYIAYGHGPGRAFVEEFRGLKSAVNYITSLKESVAEEQLEETTPDALAKIDELTRK